LPGKADFFSDRVLDSRPRTERIAHLISPDRDRIALRARYAILLLLAGLNGNVGLRENDGGE
jgi:hypothetical protein